MSETVARRRAVPLAIFALAFAVRAPLAGVARFCGDEARDYARALGILVHGDLPLLGAPITGGAARLPGPLAILALVPPLVLAASPWSDAIWFELLGALGAVLVWRALAIEFGAAAAAWAAAAWACLPWSIVATEHAWNPDLVAPVTAAGLLAAVELRRRPTPGWLLLWVGSIAILPQVHLLAAPVALPALVVLAGRAPLRSSARAWAGAGCVVLLLYVPWLVSELGSGFANSAALVHETATHARGSLVWSLWGALRVATADLAYVETAGWWGPDVGRERALLAAPLTMASIAFVAISLAIAERSAATARWSVALATSTSVAVALCWAGGRPPFAHYFYALVPMWAWVWAAAARRGVLAWRVAAVGLAAAGVVRTVEIVRRVEGPYGLAVNRAVVERMKGDGPVALDVRLPHGSPYPFEVYAASTADPPIDWRADAVVRYALVPTDAGGLVPGVAVDLVRLP